jgi:hypothetical protein
VEQQLQQNKETVRLVYIGVLEEDYSSEWSSCIPSFGIPKKNRSIKIRVIIDMSKIWTMSRLSFYLDDFLILTNRNNRVKDHLLKLEMVLARLSTNDLLG